jgi:hypothetical protein
MNEPTKGRDEFPIETTEGQRSRSVFGERAMVVFVVICLLGAAVILIGKYGGDPEAAGASGSPGPLARGSATPKSSAAQRPSPTPRVVAVTPGELPAPSSDFLGYPSGNWIRANRDLVIRDSPVSGLEVGVLKKGAFAFAFAEHDPNPLATDGYRWMSVNVPEPTGWITVGTATTSFVQAYPTPPFRASGEIRDLTSGGGRYAMIVTPPGSTDHDRPSFIATSADGATWRRAEMSAFGPYAPLQIAWGPTGWLAVAQVGQEGRIPWLWRSRDAVTWASAGSVATNPAGDPDPHRLVGSQRGYLLWMRAGDSGVHFWYSPDAITWVESFPKERFSRGEIRLVATPLGFYLWDANSGGESVGRAGQFSADGRTWSTVESGPAGYPAQVLHVENGLIGVDLDPTTGAIQVWTGHISGQQLAWLPEPEADLQLDGFGLAAVASDGRRALLVGANRSTNAPGARAGSGVDWAPIALPAAALGGTPIQAASGPTGFVLVGYRPTLRGENPIVWHQISGGWAPESTPILPLVPNPTSANCTQSLPRDAASLYALDRALAVICFGDASITLRGYAPPPCNGCVGDTQDRYVPDWLANPSKAVLALLPIEVTEGAGVQVRLAPNLVMNSGWTSHWLQVTGHFDDPASVTCRWYPNPVGGGIAAIPQSTVDQCRQEFVVTAVRVVSGP